MTNDVNTIAGGGVIYCEEATDILVTGNTVKHYIPGTTYYLRGSLLMAKNRGESMVELMPSAVETTLEYIADLETRVTELEALIDWSKQNEPAA